MNEQFGGQLALVGRAWRVFTLDIVGLLLASALIFVTAMIAVSPRSPG